MLQETMELNYVIAEKDHELMSIYLHDQAGGGKSVRPWGWYFRIGYGLVPFLAYLYDAVSLHPGNLRIGLGEAALFAMFYWAIGDWLYQWILVAMHREKVNRYRAYNRSPACRDYWGPRRVSIGPLGVVAESKGEVTKYLWSAFWKITVTDDLLFFVGAENPLYVPRKAFLSNTEFEAFVKLSRRYHEDSTAAPFAPADSPQTENTHVQPIFEDQRTARR